MPKEKKEMRVLGEIEKTEIRDLLGNGWLTHDGMSFYNTCREFGIEKTNELNKAAIKSMAPFEIDRMQRILGIVQEWCQDWFGMRHRVSKIVR